MKIQGSKLEFISWIRRDGSGTDKVEESLIELMQDEYFELNGLSMTEKTFIASGFNSFVVRMKEEKDIKKALTPMQEMVKLLNKSVKQYEGNAQQEAIFYAIIEEAKKLIEKEKFVISTSYHNGHLHAAQRFRQSGEEYYNEFYENK